MSNKKGFSFIVIGGTGTGKTTLIKNLLKKVPNKNAIVVYDVNNEYTEFYNKPFSDNFEKFASKHKKVKNAVLVFEEATIFFSTRGSNNDIRSILVRKRHQHNIIIFAFHSLSQVPNWIINLSNKMFLFKTSENPEKAYQKHGKDFLLEAQNRVINHENRHYFEIIDLY